MKIQELIDWLNSECPAGTETSDLSHDFAEKLRAKLDEIAKEKDEPKVITEYQSCDICGCHPTCLVFTPQGRFCMKHAEGKYI